MVSHNDPENDIRRTFTSRRSNISRTGRKSKIELMQDRRKIKEVTDSHKNEDEAWKSKITLNVSIEKKLCGSLMLSQDEDKNNSKMGSNRMRSTRGHNMKKKKKKNLFEESKNDNKNSTDANQIPPALDVSSDSDAEIKSVFSGRSDFEVTGGPQKRAMDLISHTGTAVNSPEALTPRAGVDTNQAGKSHFSFNHEFKELQSHDGIKIGLLDSFGSNDFSKKVPDKNHMFSKVESTQNRYIFDFKISLYYSSTF